MKSIQLLALVVCFCFGACQEDFSPAEQRVSKKANVERLRTIKTFDNLPLTRAVSIKDKLWEAGDTIRIKFLNGTEYPVQQEQVVQYAAIWLQYANLHFEYVGVNDSADVKIGFNMDTRGLSWSTIGTDCKLVPQTEPSLNFVYLEEETDAEIIQGEVLRNFGHVLGLGFEHQSPASPISLNAVKTRQHFMLLKGLSEDDVNNCILPYYNSDQANFTTYDPLSIMVLETPPSIQNRPYVSSIPNYVLSDRDTTHISEIYKFDEPIDTTIVTIEFSSLSLSLGIWLNDDVIVDWGGGMRDTLLSLNGAYQAIQSPDYPFETNILKLYGSDMAIDGLAVNYQPDLVSLDVSRSKALRNLACSGNLRNLDVSQNTMLEDLNCDHNQLSTLDVSKNRKLRVLVCNDNHLTSLNITQNDSLGYVDFSFNYLENINISQNKRLDGLCCNNNSLSSINLENNIQLKNLVCDYNNIENLNISKNQDLITLYCSYNKISSIDLSHNHNLEFLNCDSNYLTTLDVRQVDLYELSCRKNKLNKAALLAIANDIVNRKSSTTSPGTINYSPLDGMVTSAFAAKGWYLPSAGMRGKRIKNEMPRMGKDFFEELEQMRRNKLYLRRE